MNTDEVLNIASSYGTVKIRKDLASRVTGRPKQCSRWILVRFAPAKSCQSSAWLRLGSSSLVLNYSCLTHETIRVHCQSYSPAKPRPRE